MNVQNSTKDVSVIIKNLPIRLTVLDLKFELKTILTMTWSVFGTRYCRDAGTILLSNKLNKKMKKKSILKSFTCLMNEYFEAN